MAPKLLNNDQIREIYGQRHRNGVSLRDLADQYGVALATVHQIVRGQRYADVTGHEAPHAWSCTQCPRDGVRIHNIELARAAMVKILCSYCHETIEVSVSRILDRRGGVMCADCDGRSSR